MLLDYDRYLSYICPVCGQTTQRRIVPFNLSGNKAVFSCGDSSCGKEIFTVIQKKDKYIIEYLCAACGGTHRFTIGTNGFWNNDITVLTCPEASIEMISIGTEQCVKDNYEKQKEMYIKAEEELYSDPSLKLYFDIIGAVNDIAKSGSVVCSSCTENDADIELIDAGVLIICRHCGAKKIIPITSESYKELSETGTIVLE